MSQLIEKAINKCQDASETALLGKMSIPLDSVKMNTDVFIRNAGRHHLIEKAIELINEAQQCLVMANDTKPKR